MIKLNDFVDKVYVITEINSVRNDYIKEHLAKHNIEYELVVAPYAIPLKETSICNRYMLSLIYANLSIFENAIINGYNKIAVLENDIHLVDDFEEKFSSFIEHVPPDVFIYNIEDNHDSDRTALPIINEYCKQLNNFNKLNGSAFLIYANNMMIDAINIGIKNLLRDDTIIPIDKVVSWYYTNVPCYCPSDILAYALSYGCNVYDECKISKHKYNKTPFPTTIRPDDLKLLK